MKKKKHLISYRPVEDRDRSFLLKLFDSTRDDVRLYADNMSSIEKSEFIEMQFEAQDSHYKRHYPDADFLIIQLGKKDVGRLYVEEWPSQFRIIDITIDLAWRARGIGGAVMSEIIAKAKAKNKATSIHVEKNNRALHLYERLGFEIIGDTGIYHLMSLKASKEQKEKVSM